ncbi:MAG: DUF1624 domain-containing protein [bacterium]|nr:DUF1624 domain-containing protein [bacterium]
MAGLDLARGLAVIGMVLVNFVYVFSQNHVVALENSPDAFNALSLSSQGIAAFVLMGLAGRAASVFLILFGVGLSLQSIRRQKGSSSTGVAPQISRYFLLILFGLAFVCLWEADILHYIGLYGLLALLLVKLNTRWLAFSGLVFLFGSLILRALFPYESGWQPNAIGSHYLDLWSAPGIFRQLIFNGYHPVFPWITLVIWGLLLGRLDLNDIKILKRMIQGGLVFTLIFFATQSLGVSARFFPADILFILLGISNSTWILGLCLKIGQNPEPNRAEAVIRNMGRLAFSHYPGHVLLVIVPVVVFRNEIMDMTFEAAFLWSFAYLILTGIAGHLWLKRFKQGPLEKLLKDLSVKLVARWR